MATAIDVFISYAHEDEPIKDQLLQHLAGLVRDGLIRVWHDRNINGGDYWVASIDNALEQASLVLLLISPSFLASDYCYGSELRRALARAAAGETRVIPVILRPSDWHTSQLRGLQALPRDGRAVTSWSNRDEGLLDVVEGLRAVIPNLHNGTDSSAHGPGTSSDVLRYYLYISDAKIDMLLPQIAGQADRPPAAGGRRETRTRVQRLDVVRRYLEAAGRVGTIDAPGEYVSGTHDLYWGHIHSSPFQREPSPIIAFCGHTEETTFLLCGTTRHLVGSHYPDEAGVSSSHVPSLLAAFLRSVEIDGAAPQSFTRGAPASVERVPANGSDLVPSLIEHARAHVRGVEQKLEFLAKPLLACEASPGRRPCLLASPLYVALST